MYKKFAILWFSTVIYNINYGSLVQGTLSIIHEEDDDGQDCQLSLIKSSSNLPTEDTHEIIKPPDNSYAIKINSGLYDNTSQNRKRCTWEKLGIVTEISSIVTVVISSLCTLINGFIASKDNYSEEGLLINTSINLIYICMIVYGLYKNHYADRKYFKDTLIYLIIRGCYILGFLSLIILITVGICCNDREGDFTNPLLWLSGDKVNVTNYTIVAIIFAYISFFLNMINLIFYSYILYNTVYYTFSDYHSVA